MRRNVIVVFLMTLLGLLGFKIYNFKFGFTPIQSAAPLLEGSALKPSDESVGRDETFTDEQSRVKASEPDKKSNHQESKSDVLQVKTGEVDTQPNPNVHLFYYGWYGTPQHDGEFKWPKPMNMR